MKFGLIGHPVSHSKSPEFFKEAYPGRDDFSYDLIDEEDFETAYRRFIAGYDAINVTSPFKDRAFRKADATDTISRELFAVNLLKKDGNRIIGYNTDYWAVEEILKGLGCRRQNALVVGCGGAAKAAALAAKKLPMSVTLANRDWEKARDFCFAAGGITPMRLEQAEKGVPEFDLLVYAVPVRTALLDTLDLDGKTVVEANYKDPCLKDICKERGIRYVSGLEWLERQAVASFRRMTGEEPDEELVKAYCASLQ